MISKKISIPVQDNESVSGIISIPPAYRAGEGTGIIIAHGANNDMESPLIVSFSKGLAAMGYLTLRFNFLYREKGRKSPDSQKKLILTWQSVYRFLKEDSKYRPDKIVAAGKSMGGRVASQMVADGLLPVDSLIFLGYPLHAPGKKDKIRDAHLYPIKIPMLFFAGTRDPLCDIQLLKNVLARLGPAADLETVEGGNHSFNLRKSDEKTQQEVYDGIVKKTIDWLK